MNAPARFKQIDVTRAVRGAQQAGLRIGRVELDPNGKIVIITEDAAPARPGNSLDRLLKP